MAGMLAVAGAFGFSAAPIAVLTVALTGIAIVQPLAALGAMLVALPYFYRPLLIGSQQLAASELLLAVAVSGVALREILGCRGDLRVWARRARADATAVLRSPVVLASAALALLGLLYVVMPYDPSRRAETLREWRWTLLEPAVFVALSTLIARRQGLALARTVLAGSFLVGASAAAAQGLSDIVLGGGVVVEGVRRIAGPYPHPNALALLLVRGAILAAGWLAFSGFRNRFLWAVVALCAVGLGATFSRGALAAAALGLILVVWATAPRLRLMALGALLLTAAAGIVFAGNRMLDLFAGGSGSLRLDIWRSSLAMIRDRPVLGYGPDQFLYAYSPRYIAPTSWAERFTSHPHNVLLDFWIRLGIIGVAVALLGGAWCARQAIAATLHRIPDPLTSGAAITLLAALTHGLVDNAYFVHDLAMSSWLLVWLAFPARPAPVGEGSRSIEGAADWWSRVHRLASRG